MFSYTTRGQGRPILFIHGFLESATMWDDFIDENFDENFQSICIDLPGHGNSILDKEYLSLKDIAFDIYHFLLNEGIPDFDIVGHSLGGYIAIELHKLLSNESKLVLFHSNFWEDEPERRENRNRAIKVVQENKNLFIHQAIPNLFQEAFRNETFVASLIEEAKQISSFTVVLFSKLMRDRPSNEVYIKKLNTNFLLIQGQFDLIIPIELAKMHVEEINHIITNAGHMGHFEAKDEERKIIFNFFKDFSNHL